FVNNMQQYVSPQVHSIEGTLKPPVSSETDPTPPSRFEYGTSVNVSGWNVNCSLLNVITPTWPFDCTWLGFMPNSNIVLDQPATGGALSEPDVSIGLFWDAQTVPPNNSNKIVTYLGQADSTNDFAPPMSLSVTGPLALNYDSSATDNLPPPYLFPNPFTINAYVDNLLDLISANGSATTIGPINLFLDLPRGLAMAAGDVPNKSVSSLAPETEAGVGWNVQADGTATGLLTYSVSATPNIGTGKVVERTIEVPSPAQVTLIGNAINQGQFQMLSFPLVFGATPPVKALFPNLPSSSSSPVDIVRWDPTVNQYKPVTQLIPGQGYWVRSDVANTVTVTLNTSLYPPLQNQVQPSSSPYKIDYPAGWNQIGDPYLYGIPFSEVQVFDTQSLQVVTMSDAVGLNYQWVMPVAYQFNTTDPNAHNWSYQLLDNTGFIMQPYVGYWILVKKSGLQFIYPGVDTPGVSVTRAAQMGVGLGSGSGRATTNNWRLQLSATDSDSSDLLNFIGVSPHATDGQDIFKYNKPPLVSNHVALDIVHSDWSFGGQFMQDLRSPALTRKTWDLVVHSTKPNQQVTITWPGYATSVPKDYQLILLDSTGQTQREMRTNASYTVKTGSDSTYKLQIVALPVRNSGQVMITNFDIVPNGRAVGGPRSVSINYALSQPAETQVVIRDRAGRAIRTLPVSTRAALGTGAPNTGSAIWDLRDERGVTIAPGVYNVELNVVDSNGRRSRQIRPYVLTR
ncbi:MAG TPA: hypothetical protein VKT32_12940, partial [Chthonomonadaceae bacterium]|nr:hypothetical protein [Chthonomonadaceae bacterium]